MFRKVQPRNSVDFKITCILLLHMLIRAANANESTSETSPPPMHFSSFFLGPPPHLPLVHRVSSVTDPYRNGIQAEPGTLQRSDWSAGKPHPCVTRESVMEEEDGTGREAGLMFVFLFLDLA